MSQKIPSPAFVTLAVLVLAACGQPAPNEAEDGISPTQPQRSDNPKLGLMTSLPLYWPLDASFEEIAQGSTEKPWQRTLIERRFELVPLDTLSPILGFSPKDPDTDPLEGLDRLAVIQPRGLSAADNVALDRWVRAGGHLLLVLDPELTGDYDLALGDPRRPTDAALIPPIVGRIGLEITFNEDQAWSQGVKVPFSDIPLGLFRAGQILRQENTDVECSIEAKGALARCDVGKGRVTLLADAGLFEHELIIERDNGTERQPVVELLRIAFED